MERTLELGETSSVPVSIDHGQFIASVPKAELSIDAYDEPAHRQGLAVWDGGVSVFTASHWTDSTVTVALSAERPTVDLSDCDHTIEAGIALPDGYLHIYGPESTGTNEAVVRVPPGTYSLLVCGTGFETTNEYDDEGSDTYTLFLWPGPVLERRVLKDGFAWMDELPRRNRDSTQPPARPE